MSFEKLNLIEPISRALKSEGYTTPTPIQEQSIPILLERKDLLGCAQTGTGKTAAFAIPILQLLTQDELYVKGPQGIKALILTPTRELAIQVSDSFKAYGKNLKLRHTVIFGGVSQQAQTQALRAGVDILVATPGRLLDLMNQRFVKLDHLKFLVLDEADRMLDMGFVHDVKKIIAKVPAQRQTIFFSATMPAEISKLADSILTNPKRVSVAPPSSTAETVQQQVYFVEKNDKRKLLHHLLEDKGIKNVLVFTRTKHGADRVVKELSKSGIKSEAIHGNKSQNQRQRALSNFKTGQSRVLVATDIAARGIDVDNLSHVINYELPNVPETYVHRIGRTGRAGASGISISFCDAEEREYLQDIQQLIGKNIPAVTDHPFASTSTARPEMKNPRVSPPQRQPKQKQNSNRNNRSFNKKRSDQPRQDTGSTQKAVNGNTTQKASSPRPQSNRNSRNVSKPKQDNSGGQWGSERWENNY